MSDKTETTIQAWPGIELAVEQHQEWVDATGLRELDPEWRFVDENGHGHFIASEGDRLPTLRWASEPCTMGHGPDCNSEGRHECRLCGVEVTPGTRPQKSFWLQTHRSYRLTIHDVGQVVTYEFDSDDWGRLNEAVRKTVAKVLAGRETETETMAS